MKNMQWNTLGLMHTLIPTTNKNSSYLELDRGAFVLRVVGELEDRHPDVEKV